jgi:Skp family chaperone for outer membrane proteins
MTSQIEELNTKIESEKEQHNSELEERSQEIVKLTQELKDKQVENRIAGKKGDQLVR